MGVAEPAGDYGRGKDGDGVIWEQIIDSVTSAKTRGIHAKTISMNAVAIAQLTSWAEARQISMVYPDEHGAEIRVMGCRVIADESQDRPLAA